MILFDTRARNWVIGGGAILVLLILAIYLLHENGIVPDFATRWGREGNSRSGESVRLVYQGSTTVQSVAPVATMQASGPWLKLEEGLELGYFVSPKKSEFGDSRIHIVRIDPARFELKLLNASASPQGKPRTAKEWCASAGLLAAINSSMYRTDHRTSTAYMRTGGHVNNAQRNKDKMALCWDAADANLSAVHLADLDEEDWDRDVLGRYGTVVQSIRMVTAAGKNAWSQQPRKWSTAAIGMDRQGRVLLIHVRSPYSTHDLIDILRGLPIELATMQYCEGGPEAQLYLSADGVEMECIGSYETNFIEKDDNDHAWPVPNVVGIARKRS